MTYSRWRNLMGNWEDRAMFAAIVLVLYTAFSAIAVAEVTTVEALEFSRVQLLGSNELEITQGEANTLKIRGDKDELTPPPFVVQGDVLRLGVTAGGNQVNDLKFKLTATGLSEILLQGSGDIFVKPLVLGDLLVSVDGSGAIRMFDVEAQELEMEVNGSGTLQAVDVTARNARLVLKGSGDIQLGSLHVDTLKTAMAGSGDVTVRDSGSANLLQVALMGSGDIGMKNVAVKSAKVSIMGSGDVVVRVAESLEAEILGSGDLVYYGKPTTSTSVMGSGDINQKDGP